jgi:ubiquinone/menaquinone biosynthesis C-methylase UbiE
MKPVNRNPHNVAFVEETRFGNWFLSTPQWKISVLNRALEDLQRFLPPASTYDRVLDVGCGFGHSFEAIATRFKSKLIVGCDPVEGLEERAGPMALACPCPVELCQDNAAEMGFADGSFDMVFCHQTFHHIVAQEEAMAEFFRVLRPGGVLLFAESTRAYIYSLPIKLLFRHPMHVQRTYEEYVAMIRKVGFDLPESRVSTPYLWWSRPDIGFLEWIGRPVPQKREETMVNALAIKPAPYFHF